MMSALRLLYKYTIGIIWNNRIRRKGSSKSSHGNIKNSKEEEEGSSNSKWSQIEDDVLELIVERLCLTDYLRTQAVCSSWRATVAKAIDNKHCSPSPEFPLVFLRTDDANYFSFFNLSTESVFKYRRPPFEIYQVCYGTIEGWMIMAELLHTYFDVPRTDIRSVFFFNPVTNATVCMPSSLNYYTKIRKIVASSKPSDPNCVVVCHYDGYGILAFSRISDKSWTLIEGDLEARINFTEVEILDGKLYALTSPILNSILVCDLQEEPVKPKILAKLPAIRPTPRITDFGPISRVHGNILKYLAIDASSGELLLIYMFHNSTYERDNVDYMNIVKEYINPPKVTESQVFKLDMSSEPRWMEVKNLGNRMLFVGNLKSLVISTVAFDGPEELVRENCIYFTSLFACTRRLDKWRGVKIGRHRRNDRRTKYYTVERSSFVNLPTPIWFIPSVW